MSEPTRNSDGCREQICFCHDDSHQARAYTACRHCGCVWLDPVCAQAVAADPTRPKHTPLPWLLFNENGVVAIETEERNRPVVAWLGFDDCNRSPEEHAANAGHIVACVSACEGMADPEADVAARDAAVKSAQAVADCWGVGAFNLSEFNQFVLELRAALARVTGVRE